MAKTNLKDIAASMGVEKSKGSLHVTSDELPEASSFKVGDKVTLSVEGTVSSVSSGYGGDKSVSATIDIDEIESDAEEDSESPADEASEQ